LLRLLGSQNTLHQCHSPLYRTLPLYWWLLPVVDEQASSASVQYWLIQTSCTALPVLYCPSCTALTVLDCPACTALPVLYCPSCTALYVLYCPACVALPCLCCTVVPVLHCLCWTAIPVLPCLYCCAGPGKPHHYREEYDEPPFGDKGLAGDYPDHDYKHAQNSDGPTQLPQAQSRPA
jgi:hypothetical protein